MSDVENCGSPKDHLAHTWEQVQKDNTLAYHHCQGLNAVHVTNDPHYAHITVIVDDGKEAIIFDIQKMVDFGMDIDYFPPIDMDINYYPPIDDDNVLSVKHTQHIKQLTFHGQPIANADGSSYTEIRRAK